MKCVLYAPEQFILPDIESNYHNPVFNKLQNYKLK